MLTRKINFFFIESSYSVHLAHLHSMVQVFDHISLSIIAAPRSQQYALLSRLLGLELLLDCWHRLFLEVSKHMTFLWEKLLLL